MKRAFKVEIVFPAAVITNLMTTAMEGGYSVTVAKRGGWCVGIWWKALDADPPDLGPGKDPWYAEEENYHREDFCVEIRELDDERTGHETSHKMDANKMCAGLATMALKYPSFFAQILEDNIDGPCADMFLQCTLFGEAKYG